MHEMNWFYEYMKKEEVSYDDLKKILRIRKSKLPAYEAVVQDIMKRKPCFAEVRRTDGISEPKYRIIGYDKAKEMVFLQAKTGRYESSKDQEVKPLKIDEFIFGPYEIYDQVNPEVSYFYMMNSSEYEDLHIKDPEVTGEARRGVWLHLFSVQAKHQLENFQKRPLTVGCPLVNF